MSLKWTVIISVAWCVFVMAASLAGLWYLWEYRIWPRARFEERAGQVGSSVGILTAISLAPLWLYWAVQHRKRHAQRP